MSLEDAAKDEPTSEARKLRSELAKAQAAQKRAEAETKHLQQIVDHQLERLESRVRVFKASKSKASGKEWYRVIIPDSHGSLIDERAAAAFLRDMQILRPAQNIWIGDHIDCGGFLAQHHVWGYVAEANYTFAQDVEAANSFLDSVVATSPDAEQHYIEGNHERRIERWCITAALRSGHDAAMLKSKLGVEASLHLARRGFHHYEQGRTYCGLSVPATIKIGPCYFTHGSCNAKDPARKMLAKFAHNVIFGHNHSDNIVRDRILSRDCIAACASSLCVQQPMWKHTDPSTWSHGYGLQVVHGNSLEFLHINVPIVGGRSLLGPLLGVVKP